MELRNEKDARFIIQHHVTEEKLLHLEKGVRKLGFQSGGKRIMSIFLGCSCSAWQRRRSSEARSGMR